jgi:UDP-N-acetyl-D-galactosamine dehydrogenase
MNTVGEWLNGVRIAIIGLGYVGLPLAIEFGKKFSVVGFDIKLDRIEALRTGHDETLEIDTEELEAATGLSLTSDPEELRQCNVYIVTVPTPIDTQKRPNLAPLIGASETIGRVLKKGDTVIFESTVYPGCTEEECVPVLERMSGLTFNHEFTVGYSPERINPGDKLHRLPNILKVTSGSTLQSAERIDQLYGQVITAGTYKAESIKVAEAAKVIENTQRDLNIALVNELAIIFNKLGIDTDAVLRAAGTKWNFLPFRPGLVGGHCIGVDPYYLTYKAEALGYYPQVVLAGRRINDSMGSYVASQLIKAMIARRIQVNGSRVLVMGLAFKENCPDLRNSRVVDVIAELTEYGCQVDVHDPWIDPIHARAEYGLELVQAPETGVYDGVILAVAHNVFEKQGIDAIKRYAFDKHVFYDLKSLFGAHAEDLRL